MKRIRSIINWVIETSKQANKSWFYVISDFLKLRKRTLISKVEYTNYKLYNANTVFKNSFLSMSKAWQLWEILNPRVYACLARDKYISHCVLNNANIPTSELYLYYHPKLACNTDCMAYNYDGVIDILKSKHVKQCVIKPSQDSAHGEGVIVSHTIEFNEDDCILKRYDGTYIDLKRILQDTPLLFESLVQQDNQLSKFNSSSVNTIRMMTALYPDNTVKLFAAFIKIGRDGSDVDNAGAGGNVDAAIDIKSGKLYNAIEFNSWQNIVKINNHPDSDAPIEGEYINNWNDIVCKICDYQARIPQLKTIGWDVAITEDGPIIIEINNWWDTTGQLFINRGWKNEVLDCYNSWINFNKR